MKKSILISILLNGLLISCTTLYEKPGASQQDWHRDYNNCLVKANQAGYSGGDFASNLNRKNFIDMCLQGQGWHESSPERTEANLARKAVFEERNAELNSQMKDFNLKIEAICAKAKYVKLIAHSPCFYRDITFEHMTDDKKLEKSQKKIFLSFRNEIRTTQAGLREYMRENSTSQKEKNWVTYLDSTEAIIDGYSLDLYNQKITWGEYNKSRKDFSLVMDLKYKEIFKKD